MTDSESTLVACPACSGLNRVPDARLEQGPTCGKCGKPLFDGHPVALDEAGFHAHVERATLPVLVDFWAPWCGPCRMMAPQFEAAAARMEPHVRLAKVDTQAQPALGSRFNIRSIPTVALFLDGKEIARQAGAMNAADILRWTALTLTNGEAPT